MSSAITQVKDKLNFIFRSFGDNSIEFLVGAYREGLLSKDQINKLREITDGKTCSICEGSGVIDENGLLPCEACKGQ